MRRVRNTSALLNAGITLRVPARGSGGSLVQTAAIGRVLIGPDQAEQDGQIPSATAALARIGRPPCQLQAKKD